MWFHMEKMDHPICCILTSIKGGISAITPLLRITLYIAQKEKPLQSYTDETELQTENGVKISTAYKNTDGYKVMIWVPSLQLPERQRVNLSLDGNSNFVSFTIDRLNVVKKTHVWRRVILFTYSSWLHTTSKTWEFYFHETTRNNKRWQFISWCYDFFIITLQELLILTLTPWWPRW